MIIWPRSAYNQPWWKHSHAPLYAAIRVALFGLLLALAGCGKDNVRVEYRDRLVPVQTPLPAELTTAPAYPADPPFACTDARGARTVCRDDEEDWIESLKKVARDAIDQLQRIHALQPK